MLSIMPEARNVFPSFASINILDTVMLDGEETGNMMVSFSSGEHFQNPDYISFCELGKISVCTINTATTAGISLAQMLGLYYDFIPTKTFTQPSRSPITIGLPNTCGQLQSDKSTESLTCAIFN